MFISSGYTANCDTRSFPSKQPSTSALCSTGNFERFISSFFQPVSESSCSVTWNAYLSSALYWSISCIVSGRTV